MNREIPAGEILGMEQRYQATFINSLAGFRSLCLIGTRSYSGQSNLAVFNSYFHVGANPPLFGIVVRPDSVERHTLANIMETGQLTVNHVHESFYTAAHQTSARYAADRSEFAETELTEEYRDGIYAPFVQESRVKIGASFRQRIDVPLNGTVIIVAEITHVSLPDDILMPDGYADLERAGSLTCCGLDSYHKTSRIARMAYAKPDVAPTAMNS